MKLKNDEILVSLIEELNWFTVGKTIDAVMFDQDAEKIDGFNIFFDDDSALLVKIDNGQLYWQCATAEMMEEYLKGEVDEE